MRIVLLGDSHLARIRRRLAHLGDDVVNAAVGGATVHDLIPQATAAAIGRGDVVLVSIGTNDAAPWRKVPVDVFRHALERFLGSSGADSCVVLLPPGVIEESLDGRADRTDALIEDYRAAVTSAAAGAGADVVDVRAELFAMGPSTFAGDGLHLSGEGYRVLLPALNAALAPTRLRP